MIKRADGFIKREAMLATVTMRRVKFLSDVKR